MGDLPFTKRDRKRLCYQYGYGYRSTNDWGSGDLPAPFAEGDIVELVRPGAADDRLSEMTGPFFVVSAGFSIGEGDEWYFRVTDGSGGNSDRLHVGYKDRRTGNWGGVGDVDYMAAFDLIDTSDPEGLAKRERLLAEGWATPDTGGSLRLPGYDVCGECDGDGVIQYGVGSGHYEAATGFANSAGEEHPCPTCSGVGSVPGDAAVEAAAKAIASEFAEDVDESHHDGARAALVAYAQHTKEN